MAQANDSIAVTPGTGATVATQNPGDGKEYQVVMVASATGHLQGDVPTYYYQTAQAAAAQNKIFFEVFNASGSGKILRLRKLFIQSNVATQTGVGMQFDLNRTSAVGTSGTTLTAALADTANAAVPAQVTARSVPTGGATTAGAVFSSPFLSSEETQAGTHFNWAFNYIPEGENIQRPTAREGEGLKLTQITNSTAGSWSVCAVITLE